jgi:uncharacterized membrane protein
MAARSSHVSHHAGVSAHPQGGRTHNAVAGGQQLGEIMVNLLNKYFMKKNKIIVIAIIVAVVIICLVSIKYLPFWSTIISTATAVAGFFAGWYAKKWYDQNRKEE